MRKGFLIVLLILVIAVPVLTGHSSWKRFKAQKRGNLPPNVRKCLTVKCDRGFSCFYGRCIVKDEACATIRCADGFRCLQGKCIPRKNNPKKMVCPPMGFKLKKEKCDWALKKQCRRRRNNVIKDVCGFNPFARQQNDYKSPCDACRDNRQRNKFFYALPCVDAPRICDRYEECMNGVCTGIFKDDAFKDKETCNVNKECGANENCAGHKCIDRRDLYDYLESVAEYKDVLMRMA